MPYTKRLKSPRQSRDKFNQIYWGQTTNVHDGSIQRANLSGENQTALITFNHGRPKGIGLDTDSEKMYWAWDSGSQNHVFRANFDGSSLGYVRRFGRKPWDIDLDVSGGKIYWTEFDGPFYGKIYRSNFDGSEKELLFSDLSDPTGIALDLEAGKVYWTDRHRGKIQRANLDGSDVEDVLTGLTSPWGIEVVSIPEPATFLLLGIGGLVIRKR